MRAASRPTKPSARENAAQPAIAATMKPSITRCGPYWSSQRPSGAAVPGSLAARVVDGARKHAWAVTSSNLYEALRAGYWYDVDHKTVGNNAVAISELTSNIATGPDGGPWRDQRGALVQLT